MDESGAGQDISAGGVTEPVGDSNGAVEAPPSDSLLLSTLSPLVIGEHSGAATSPPVPVVNHQPELPSTTNGKDDAATATAVTPLRNNVSSNRLLNESNTNDHAAGTAEVGETKSSLLLRPSVTDIVVNDILDEPSSFSLPQRKQPLSSAVFSLVELILQRCEEENLWLRNALGITTDNDPADTLRQTCQSIMERLEDDGYRFIAREKATHADGSGDAVDPASNNQEMTIDVKADVDPSISFRILQEYDSDELDMKLKIITIQKLVYRVKSLQQQQQAAAAAATVVFPYVGKHSRASAEEVKRLVLPPATKSIFTSSPGTRSTGEASRIGGESSSAKAVTWPSERRIADSNVRDQDVLTSPHCKFRNVSEHPGNKVYEKLIQNAAVKFVNAAMAKATEKIKSTKKGRKFHERQLDLFHSSLISQDSIMPREQQYEAIMDEIIRQVREPPQKRKKQEAKVPGRFLVINTLLSDTDKQGSPLGKDTVGDDSADPAHHVWCTAGRTRVRLQLKRKVERAINAYRLDLQDYHVRQKQQLKTGKAAAEELWKVMMVDPSTQTAALDSIKPPATSGPRIDLSRSTVAAAAAAASSSAQRTQKQLSPQQSTDNRTDYHSDNDDDDEVTVESGPKTDPQENEALFERLPSKTRIAGTWLPFKSIRGRKALTLLSLVLLLATDTRLLSSYLALPEQRMQCGGRWTRRTTKLL
jgi:hypothetical protein